MNVHLSGYLFGSTEKNCKWGSLFRKKFTVLFISFKEERQSFNDDLIMKIRLFFYTYMSPIGPSLWNQMYTGNIKEQPMMESDRLLLFLHEKVKKSNWFIFRQKAPPRGLLKINHQNNNQLLINYKCLKSSQTICGELKIWSMTVDYIAFTHDPIRHPWIRLCSLSVPWSSNRALLIHYIYH